MYFRLRRIVKQDIFEKHLVETMRSETSNDEQTHPNGPLLPTTRFQRTYYTAALFDSNEVHNIWIYHVIQGPFDVKQFEHVIKQIALEVPLLQTRLVLSNENVWQVRDRSIRANLRVIDIRDHSTPFEEAVRRMTADARKYFSMVKNELYDFVVYIIDKDKYVLYTMCHHGICDGRSLLKLNSILTVAYNDAKKGKKIQVRPRLHLDAIARAENMYYKSSDYQRDYAHWMGYVQKLQGHAHFQRKLTWVHETKTNVCLVSYDWNKLQQTAASLNLTESIVCIGITSLMIRSLLGTDYVTITLLCAGTNLVQEIGNSANVFPVIFRVSEYSTLQEFLMQVNEHVKSLMVYQRFRYEDSTKHFDYKARDPVVNIMLFEQDEAFDDCVSARYDGTLFDTELLNIRFFLDQTSNRVDVTILDTPEGHSNEELVHLGDYLTFIKNQVENAPDTSIATLDRLVDQYRADKNIEYDRGGLFALRRSPYAAGFLLWNQTMHFLMRSICANTWIGSGPSPFPMSKILLADRVVYLGDVKLSDPERIRGKSKEEPGTIIKMEEDCWHISVADHVIELWFFRDECGQLIKPETLAEQCNLREGDQLPIFTPEQVERLNEMYAIGKRSDSYWSQRFTEFHSCTMSFVDYVSYDPPVWAATDFQKLQTSSIEDSAINLLAAWLIYISRNSQSSQIQIGWDATESNRRYQDIDVLAAHIFAKTVPFSIFIDSKDTFSNVVTNVQENFKQLTSYLPCFADLHVRHAMESFNELCRIHPWAQAVSIINNSNADDMAKDTVALYAHANLLTLQINKHDDSFRWIYNTNQISVNEVNRISSHLLVLLESADSSNPVNKLDLLPKTEREILLNVWKQTDETYPDSCIHQLFEEQVDRDGQAIAVECDGESLSYAELNAQANRLAHYLIAKGVQPDDRIALCARRNTKMLIAILGILKSGGAYVPLDSAYSRQWLTNILEDSQSMFLLTDATGQEVLIDHEVAVLDLDQALSADISIDNPNSINLGLTSANLAYVLYTSGLNGKLEGVMIEHRNATNLIHWSKQTFSAEDFEHTLFSSSIGFGMSVFECFVPLSLGKMINIVPNAFAITQMTSKCTLFNTVPTTLMTIIRTGTLPSSIHTIIVAGEPLNKNLINRVFIQTQVTKLYNIYGATEALCTTCHMYTRGDDIIETIGRPIANTRTYLLDAHGEPVPLGVAGELYIGGAGLARGYLNQPEQTNERFSSNPFSDSSTARIYRTGDRARYLHNGNLEFLGRVNQKLTVRNLQIRTSEIEDCLIEHSLVSDAVVHFWSSGNDKWCLVAYVVAEADKSLPQTLRTYIASILPFHMVPAAFVCVPSLPLTLNGKLNWYALPVPDADAFAVYEAPSGEMEEKLAAIWSECLGIERIGRYDNYFDLGGNSMIATLMYNKIKKLYNIKLERNDLYLHPVLKDFAKRVSKSFKLCCDSAIPIRQRANRTPLFCLPDGKGDISYAFELAREIDNSIPIYVLPWASPEKQQPPSIEKMASAMIEHIKKVQPDGPCALAGYSSGGILAYEIAKQLLSSDYTVSFLCLIDTYAMRVSKYYKHILKIVIEDTKDINVDLENKDADQILQNQITHYNNICAAYHFEALPICVNLFKAIDCDWLNGSHKIQNRNSYKKIYDRSKLGWENYDIPKMEIIPVNGNHVTMMTDRRNRSELGSKITELLVPKETDSEDNENSGNNMDGDSQCVRLPD